MKSNLRSVLNRQKDLLIELENEVRNIENSDLTKENERLKAEIEKLQAEYIKSEQNTELLSDENKSLKNALYEQVYNEKVKIVQTTQEKIDIYFKSSLATEQNRLANLEENIIRKINNMRAALHDNNISLDAEISKKLGELAIQVNAQITEARTRYAETHGVFSKNERAEFEKLKNEQITDEQILAVAKKNNIERFVGLNLLNKVGILLIIIGVIAAAQYTYLQLPDTLKGVMMFTLGAIMLVAGEVMNRKNPNVFSLGITAGGVGVLYSALAISYFGLEILHMYTALLLCVLITAVTFILSTRYESQTILSFALVGGYLPMFSIYGSDDRIILYGAMVYFVVLNLLALMVAFRRKWTIATYIGLILNIVCTAAISITMSQTEIQVQLLNKILTVTYILFAFLIYSAIPILGTYNVKSKFKKTDVILLAINTFFSSLIMYLTFYSFEWEAATGVLAIVFAVLYLYLGRIVESLFTDEKHMQALFYLTGLTFVILIIPFQFGSVWLSLGWLAQGVALTVYGILKEEKNFIRAGYVINGLCLCAFIFVDVFARVDQLFATDHLFTFKYLAITFGSIIILGSYIYKKTLSFVFQRVYTYVVVINFWIFAMYLTFQEFNTFLNRANSIFYKSNLDVALAITLTFIIAYVVLRIKVLSDVGVKIIAGIFYVIGLLWLFGMNSNSFVYWNYIGEIPRSVTIAATVILIAVSLFSVFIMRDLVKLVVMEKKLGVEWYPLIVSAYFVIVLTQNLIVQYDLSFTSAWISIIYVVTALLWIIFGFARMYSFIRKAGLGLALLAVIKLFIIDLAHLTQGYRIISYFVLGITLVAISFVYQYFNKRLELKMEVLQDASKKN